MGVLIAIIVVTLSGQGIHAAKIDCAGVVDTGFYIVQETDSSGRYVMEVRAGVHQLVVSKVGYRPFIGTLDSTKGDIVVELQEDSK